MTRYSTFDEFWPYYLQQHASEDTRRMHYLGTASILPVLAALTMFKIYHWLWAAVVVAYAFAWIGHAVFEKNRPATFTYPLWSLRGDMLMFWLWLTGRLNGELAAAGVRSAS